MVCERPHTQQDGSFGPACIGTVPPAAPTDHGGPGGTAHGPDPRRFTHGPWALGASPTDRGSTVHLPRTVGPRCITHGPWAHGASPTDRGPMVLHPRTVGPRCITLGPWAHGASPTDRGRMVLLPWTEVPRYASASLLPHGSTYGSYGPRLPRRHLVRSGPTVHHPRTVCPRCTTHGPRVHGALLPACTVAVTPMVPTDHGDPGGTAHVLDPGCSTNGGLLLASPRYHGPTVPAAPWLPALPPTDQGSTAFFSLLLRLVPPANPTDHGGSGGTTHGPNPVSCVSREEASTNEISPNLFKQK